MAVFADDVYIEAICDEARMDIIWTNAAGKAILHVDFDKETFSIEY